VSNTILGSYSKVENETKEYFDKLNAIVLTKEQIEKLRSTDDELNNKMESDSFDRNAHNLTIYINLSNKDKPIIHDEYDDETFYVNNNVDGVNAAVNEIIKTAEDNHRKSELTAHIKTKKTPFRSKITGRWSRHSRRRRHKK
jgi:hypothetical protein